jgi:hypothetical protein
LEENFDRFQFEIYKEKEMADFRKYVYALAVLALLLGSAVSARAQTPGPAFQCVANAGVPALLRAEGLTELNGEVTLNCTGVPVGWPTDGNGIPFVDPTGVVPPPGVTPATVNIQVFLNTNITSRWADPESEALLLIDDPPAVGPPGPVMCARRITPPTCTARPIRAMRFRASRWAITLCCSWAFRFSLPVPPAFACTGS